MVPMSVAAAVERIPGVRDVRLHIPLSSLTTFRIGGPADCLVDVRTGEALSAVLAVAAEAGVPVTVMGGGSNLLVGDGGVRGIVVRLRFLDVIRPTSGVVRAGAGVSMNALARWTIARGLSALESWAGTPGTVGGAIFGNAHYDGRNIGTLVGRVAVVTRAGARAVLSRDAMQFDYDRSRLQQSGELLEWAEFGVVEGDPDELRAVARRSLNHRKRTQPLNVPSAGCVFQNPNPAIDPVPAGLPCSAGALIDAAGLKGYRVGGAKISDVHANFFVNDAGATARDMRALIELARNRVRDRFGVLLKDEIVTIGEF